VLNSQCPGTNLISPGTRILRLSPISSLYYHIIEFTSAHCGSQSELGLGGQWVTLLIAVVTLTGPTLWCTLHHLCKLYLKLARLSVSLLVTLSYHKPECPPKSYPLDSKTITGIPLPQRESRSGLSSRLYGRHSMAWGGR
jgi:hypothetical protein